MSFVTLLATTARWDRVMVKLKSGGGGGADEGRGIRLGRGGHIEMWASPLARLTKCWWPPPHTMNGKIWVLQNHHSSQYCFLSGPQVVCDCGLNAIDIFVS